MLKYSQFNSIVQFDNEFCLYNAFTNRVIFLVPELKDMLHAAINEGIENLKDYHPSFFEYLIQKEFVLEETVDEVEKVRAISKRVDENEEEYLLTINPTMNCNFKCWYCYETHIKQSKLTSENITKINKFIERTVQNPKLKRFSLSLFGGEPLLYFEKTVIPLVDHYSEQCLKANILPDVGFTTNGYLINQSFIDYFNNKNIKCALQITLDGYKDEHDKVRSVNSKKGSYDTIVKNIRLLVQNNFTVRVRINYTDKNIHNAGKILDDFSDLSSELKLRYIFFDFHRVWQDAGGEDVTSELEVIMNKLRAGGFYAQTNSSINNVINSCYADKRNSVTINYNGDIYKCTARDFNKANRQGYINENGELIWEENSLEKRMDIKFKNPPCLTCRLLPICNGGCSQLAWENVDQEYCVHNSDEKEKDKVIKAQIDQIKTNFRTTLIHS